MIFHIMIAFFAFSKAVVLTNTWSKKQFIMLVPEAGHINVSASFNLALPNFCGV